MIIKAHVARMTAGGAKAAALHLRYIERDGVEKDGSKGGSTAPRARAPRDVRGASRRRAAPVPAHRVAGGRARPRPHGLRPRLMGHVERDLGRSTRVGRGQPQMG